MLAFNVSSTDALSSKVRYLVRTSGLNFSHDLYCRSISATNSTNVRKSMTDC